MSLVFVFGAFRASHGDKQMKVGFGGILSAAIVVLLVVYVYNKFIAKDGESIATLGKGK